MFYFTKIFKLILLTTKGQKKIWCCTGWSTIIISSIKGPFGHMGTQINSFGKKTNIVQSTWHGMTFTVHIQVKIKYTSLYTIIEYNETKYGHKVFQ